MTSRKGLMLVSCSASKLSFYWNLVKKVNGEISNKSNRNESIYAIIQKGKSTNYIPNI